MKLIELRNRIKGKELKNIITLNINAENSDLIKELVKGTYEDGIDNLKMLIFEDLTLLFVDFDCDGYRSGDWHILVLSELLDKGWTKEIKNINSIVNDIQCFETFKDEITEMIMITTNDYIITMGQDCTDSYYPRNFFNIEDTKEKAIKESEIKISAELVEVKDEKTKSD